MQNLQWSLFQSEAVLQAPNGSWTSQREVFVRSMRERVSLQVFNEPAHAEDSHEKRGSVFIKFLVKFFNFYKFLLILISKFPVDESLNCHLCSKEFEKKYNLELHIKRVHSKVESQTCNICFAEFSSGNNLNQHIKQAHMDTANVSIKRSINYCHHLILNLILDHLPWVSNLPSPVQS